ncbi:site-specific recombinase, phage integrase family [Luminiphilus syltensis NOR5-1B]|uniref:Site-specific recombinase, phage integrase family n=1 Tax=Luminiphilus syltensis NOR5-1B TaxID=565045 RepID=B8KTC0_9GAMM|nr:site-specific integrase [Luminiphilus syltensis]EED34318.1 site-specific recombinase, phage integrase family [Luminiphilus syltensis NOR5-1B]
MTTFQDVAEAWIASREHCVGSLGRIQFWVEEFGDQPIDAITEDAVDQALVRLAKRGKLKAGRGSARRAVPTGKPLAGSTINRFISTLSGIFKYARRVRALPRSHTPPTRGIEKAPEPVDPEKYFRPEEVDKLMAVARVVDQKWRKLPALIILGFHTGLRVGNLLDLKWEDVDLDERTLSVATTKNGRPHIAALTDRCITELQKLPAGSPSDLVFRSYRTDKPFNYRDLWQKVCDEAGFEGRTFHWLRHGCGSALASAGVSQAQIMQVMGHRTLVASARYMHSNVEDRRAVVGRVFQ